MEQRRHRRKNRTNRNLLVLVAVLLIIFVAALVIAGTLENQEEKPQPSGNPTTGSSGQTHRGDAAEVGETDKAVIVDVGDDEADAVHVCGEHDLLAAGLAVLFDDDVAESVGGYRVGIGCGYFHNGKRDAFLAAGGGYARIQCAQSIKYIKHFQTSFR